MRIRLTEPRTVRGAERRAREILDLHDSLATRMILAGVAVQATPEAQDAVDLEELKKEELLGYAKERGISVTGKMSKREILEKIDAEG